MAFLRKEVCIGLVGMYGSGKTVFLTSLINHLESHTLDNGFDVGQRRKQSQKVVKFEELPCDKGWSEFPYQAYRDALLHGDFPAKTGEAYQFCCQYQLKSANGNWGDWYRIKFFDIPGERIADAPMLHLNYGEWSDRVVKDLEGSKKRRDASHKFLDYLRETPSDERVILAEYKRTLYTLIRQYNAYVSPSTFVYDLDGNPPCVDEGDAIQNQYCGLPDAEFAPMSSDARKRSPELAKRFEKHFNLYRKNVVTPVFTALRDCQSVCCLVSVLDLLAAGPEMYNDNRSMLNDLFRSLRPGSGWIGRSYKWVRWSLTNNPGKGINRLALVASMADRAVPDDRGKMKTLVQTMLDKLVDDYSGLQVASFVCSAIRSTTFVGNDPRRLAGILRENKDREEWQVGEVPETWPIDWVPGSFTFPRPFSRPPKVMHAPPDHIDLDAVFRFLIQ